MAFKNLRQFQKEAVRWACSHSKGNGEWLLLKSPTGTGKTYMGLGILYELFLKDSNIIPVFLTFRILGVQQTKAKLLEMYKAGFVSKRFCETIQISVINSFYLKGNQKGRKALVVDEAHHLSRDGEFSIGLKNNDSISTLIGMTGTPKESYEIDGFERIFFIDREDTGISFPKIHFDPICVKEEQLKSLRIDKYLNRTEAIQDLCEVLERENKNSFYKFIAKITYQKRNSIKKGIIFIPRIDEAEYFCKILNSLFGKMVACQVCSDNPRDLPTIISAFSNPESQIKFLVGDKILEEAFDEPLIDTLIFTKDTSSDIKYSQMIGRAIRESKGKDKVNVIDFRNNVDNYHERISNIDYLFTGSRYGFTDYQSSRKNSSNSRYRVTLNYEQRSVLFNIIRDQLEYFAMLAPDRIKTDENSFLTPLQVYQFLQLFCFNLSENPHLVHEYFSVHNPTIEEMQGIMSSTTNAPLEVRLVKHIVKPLIEIAFNVTVEIEKTLPNKNRADLIICNNPGTIYEFGIEETDIKLEQILGYQNELNKLGNNFKHLVIVGCSFSGEARSRFIQAGVQFYNWKDFFIQVLNAQELVEIVTNKNQIVFKTG
jgi:superfamily II DNA or RNA helicase